MTETTIPTGKNFDDQFSMLEFMAAAGIPVRATTKSPLHHLGYIRDLVLNGFLDERVTPEMAQSDTDVLVFVTELGAQALKNGPDAAPYSTRKLK